MKNQKNRKCKEKYYHTKFQQDERKKRGRKSVNRPNLDKNHRTNSQICDCLLTNMTSYLYSPFGTKSLDGEMAIYTNLQSS